MPKDRQKVIVVGGGVGGLTAAHELVERDFDVVVYERKTAMGGKAASVRVPSDGQGLPSSNGASAASGPTGQDSGFPGEHGFRFFPGWYRHLPDTLRRIPVRGRRDWPGEHSVFDHLVPTVQNLLVQYEQDAAPIVLHSPKNRDQLQALASFVRQLGSMGLPFSDVTLFLGKLASFLRAPEEERKRKYDKESWWSFLDAGDRSNAFRTLTIATTRTLVAAKAEEASAYTIALLAVRTLFDSPLRSDNVLDGPSSEVWIEPWVLYLKARGVKFEDDYELEALQFDGSGPRLESVSFVKSSDELYIRQLREAAADETINGVRAKLSHIDRWSRSGHAVQADEPSLRRAVATVIAHNAPDRRVERADHYVFSIPVEQMAYYVNRSTTATSYDPKLRDIVVLSASVDWMAGIQFYFKYPLDIVSGHIVCADSEWALTAVEQTQFWKDIQLPKNVQSLLSVDISAWDKPGRVHRKPAFLCTREEIAEEVWEQLKASLNRSGDQDVLREDALVNGKLLHSYHVDDNIVERYDRKKQAAFARGADRALNRVAQTAQGADEVLAAAESVPDAPFVFGDRLEMNVEPLLVNRPGSLSRRPPARTKIKNMFLAADYVDTATNLACMEGANEAARHAVNAILEASGSREEKCRTWRFEDGEVVARMASLLSYVERVPGAKTSFEAAAGAAAGFSSFAARATDVVKQIWKKT